MRRALEAVLFSTLLAAASAYRAGCGCHRHATATCAATRAAAVRCSTGGSALSRKVGGALEAVALYEQVTIESPAEGPPAQEITVVDLMPSLRAALKKSGMIEGQINVVSRHTTTSITINEWESRLARDLKEWLLRLAPADDRSEVGHAGAGVRYAHNDIELRPESADELERCLENGWDVNDPAELERWRAQEPINAHSHLAAMLLGSSEVVPVTEGQMVLGQWQSVMLVDVDGPRQRTVGVQCIGYK